MPRVGPSITTKGKLLLNRLKGNDMDLLSSCKSAPGDADKTRVCCRSPIKVGEINIRAVNRVRTPGGRELPHHFQRCVHTGEAVGPRNGRQLESTLQGCVCTGQDERAAIRRDLVPVLQRGDLSQ